MRILSVYLYHNVQYGMGGSSRGVYELVTGMRDYYGVEVRGLMNAGPLRDALREKGVVVNLIPRERSQTLKMISAIAKEIREFKPDLIHSNHRYTTFLLDIFFKNKNIPILHTERAQAWDKRFLYRYGHFATAVAPSLRDHLIQYYRVPSHKVKAITNAVDFSEPEESKVRSLREKYPKGSNQVFALCAGRFEEQKGHVYLVEAVSQLSAEHKKRLKIFLAGDGKYEADLRNQMERLGIRDCFVFLGYCDPLSEPLALCDFFILPSLWEGLPRSVIESFFAGKPVIATNIPGNLDVVKNDQNGLLVPVRNPSALAKAIEHFLDHPEDISRMALEAKASSKNHEIKRVLSEYYELYEQLIRESL